MLINCVSCMHVREVREKEMKVASKKGHPDEADHENLMDMIDSKIL